MTGPGKRPCWSTGAELVRSFQYRTRTPGDRMVILGAVWQKELGHLHGQWELVGLKQGLLYVKPKSAAAAQELQLRAAGLVRSLNKYFARAWIKGIKVAAR
ncbi:MAG: DciA family protein [Elusimicrobia bacterium]|nr:DciA family protein [Elusimicrobiota bacterium]